MSSFPHDCCCRLCGGKAYRSSEPVTVGGWYGDHHYQWQTVGGHTRRDGRTVGGVWMSVLTDVLCLACRYPAAAAAPPPGVGAADGPIGPAAGETGPTPHYTDDDLPF